MIYRQLNFIMSFTDIFKKNRKNKKNKKEKKKKKKKKKKKNPPQKKIPPPQGGGGGGGGGGEIPPPPEPKSRIKCGINSAPAALLVESRTPKKSFIFLLEE